MSKKYLHRGFYIFEFGSVEKKMRLFLLQWVGFYLRDVTRLITNHNGFASLTKFQKICVFFTFFRKNMLLIIVEKEKKYSHSIYFEALEITLFWRFILCIKRFFCEYSDNLLTIKHFKYQQILQYKLETITNAHSLV